MKLPRVIASTPPPRETGLVRAQDIGALTRTGGQEFEAIAGAGRALQAGAGLAFRAHQNRQALDDQAFAGEADKRAFDAYKEGMGTYKAFDPSVGNTLPANPKDYYDGTKIINFDNPKKEEFHNATYKDFETKILNLAKGFKSEKNQQAFINRWSVEGYTDFEEAGNAKLQEYQEQLLLGNARIAATNGDTETANRWIDIAEKYGLIGPKKAAALRIDNAMEGASNIAFDTYKQSIAAGMTEQEATKEGLKVIRESKIIPGDKKQELEQDLIASIGYRRALDKQEFDKIAEEQNQNIADVMKAGGDVQVAIDGATNLTVKQKRSWESAWKNLNKSILEDDIDNAVVNQHDPLEYNRLLNMAVNDPLNSEVNSNNLFDKTLLGRATTKDGKVVPGGITTKQKTQIDKARDEALKIPDDINVLKRPSVKRAQQEIGRIRTVLTKGETVEEGKLIESRIGTIQNDLDAYAKSLDPLDPGFDEKIQKKKDLLLEPEIKEATFNWLKFLMPSSVLTEPLQFFTRRREKEMPEPTTQAEYDALPSGTEYMDTDGTLRRKK